MISTLVVDGVGGARDAAQVGGFFDVGEFFGHISRPVLTGLGTFGGILTASIFDKVRAHDGKTPFIAYLRTIMGGREFFIAGMIAPIVLCSVYDKLVALDSMMLTFLFAYQNGFFWEKLVDKLGSKATDGKALRDADQQ
jgi:hypothetical protein